MKASVQQYVQQCRHCQRNKAVTQKKAGQIVPIPVTAEKFAFVTLDFIVALALTAAGYNAILVVVDKFTKYVKLIPTTENCTAEEVARLYHKHIATKGHGMPKTVLSDRGPQFAGKFFAELMRCFNSKHVMSTAYHPETDGQTERMNRIVEEVLRNYIDPTQVDWDQHLDNCEFAINNSVHSATGYSPYFLHNGYHPRTPLAWSRPTESRSPTVQVMLNDMRSHMQRAYRCIQAAQDKMKSNADEHRRAVVFQPGDYVLLSTKNLNIQGGVKKLQPKYCGPFQVVSSIRDTAYKLKLPQRWKIHPVFHVSLLRPWTGTTRIPEPLIVEDTTEFVVNSILAHRKSGSSNRIQYLVSWRGWGPEHNSWEASSKLKGEECTEVLRAYWQKPREITKRRHKRIAFMQASAPSVFWRGDLKD